MYKNYIKHKIIENQVKVEKPVSFADNFAQNPKQLSMFITPSQTKILDTIICLDNKYGTVFAGQKEISNNSGISYNHCNKMIKQLVDWGFIEKESRGFKKSLQYYLNPIFKDKSVRARLSKYFPSLRWVPIITLMAASINLQSKELQTVNHQPIRERNIFIYPYHTVIDNYTVKNATTYGKNLNINLKKDEKNILCMNSYQKKNILEQIANKNYENVIPNHIRELKNLNLTKWGQIRLSVFPEAAIANAIRTLGSNKVNCKFSYIIKICMDYCRKNDIRPDWKWQNQLFEVLQKPDDAKMFLQASNLVCEKRIIKQFEPEIFVKKCPLEEIKKWEDWYNSGGSNNPFMPKFTVFQCVLDAITFDEIPQEEIQRLFNEYPFIKEKFAAKGLVES